MLMQMKNDINNNVTVYSGPSQPEEVEWVKGCILSLGARYGQVKLSKELLGRVTEEDPYEFVKSLLVKTEWVVENGNGMIIVSADIPKLI